MSVNFHSTHDTSFNTTYSAIVGTLVLLLLLLSQSVNRFISCYSNQRRSCSPSTHLYMQWEAYLRFAIYICIALSYSSSTFAFDDVAKIIKKNFCIHQQQEDDRSFSLFGAAT